MATYHPEQLLDGDAPGPWSAPVELRYDQRDVLLYAVGIGCTDLRQVYERDPGFAVFPTFAIRWGGLGLKVDEQALPPSPGPLTIDAERSLTQHAPLPPAGAVRVRSRLTALHPRGQGAALVEGETEVVQAGGADDGRLCLSMGFATYRRGVAAIGDIAPFAGQGTSRSVKLGTPERAPDLDLGTTIAANQAMVYRLSGDWNPLHISPEAARFGGFDAPILHGLCTLGHCAQMLLGAVAGGDAARFKHLSLRFSSPVLPGDRLQVLGWHEAPGQLQFEARVGGRAVVSHARFAWLPPSA